MSQGEQIIKVKSGGEMEFVIEYPSVQLDIRTSPEVVVIVSDIVGSPTETYDSGTYDAGTYG